MTLKLRNLIVMFPSSLLGLCAVCILQNIAFCTIPLLKLFMPFTRIHVFYQQAPAVSSSFARVRLAHAV